MSSVYKNAAGRQAIRAWCESALDKWPVANTRTTIPTSAGSVHLLASGHSETAVLLVPGTSFNAAMTLPWAAGLSQHWKTYVIDVPGQPGLSDGERPVRDRLAWYGRVLAEVLYATQLERVIVIGNSLGGAIALACDSPRIAGRVLVSPAGIVRLAVPPKLIAASVPWMVRPTPERTRRLLELFVPPGQQPPEREVEWMALIARHCRTTLAPPPLPSVLLRQRGQTPCAVSVGEHDLFLAPWRLRPAVRRHLGVELRVYECMGHLTTDDHLDEVVELVAEVADASSRPGYP